MRQCTEDRKSNLRCIELTGAGRQELHNTRRDNSKLHLAPNLTKRNQSTESKKISTQSFPFSRAGVYRSNLLTILSHKDTNRAPEPGCFSSSPLFTFSIDCYQGIYRLISLYFFPGEIWETEERYISHGDRVPRHNTRYFLF